MDRIRGDIREDRGGRRLRLALRVRDAESCRPIENAVVDVWHSDAQGIYSGFESASTSAEGGAPPPSGETPPAGGAQPGDAGGGSERSDDRTYLRGAQVTNAEGIVEFTTIYPGWYRGRTPHIHVKVHLDRTNVLTTQLFFTDAFSRRVFTRPPYSEDAGQDTFNSNDGIFDEQLLLTVREEPGGVLGVMTFDVERA